MDLEDPLSEYRVGTAETAEELDAHLESQGIVPEVLYDRGGPPVALAGDRLFLVDEGSIYRIDREHVVALHSTRAPDYRMMRWGVGFYLLGLPAIFFNWIVAGLLAIGGGVLVTMGFLSKALLVEVDDERLPPFVIDHRRSSRIRERITHWVDRER